MTTLSLIQKQRNTYHVRCELANSTFLNTKTFYLEDDLVAYNDREPSPRIYEALTDAINEFENNSRDLRSFWLSAVVGSTRFTHIYVSPQGRQWLLNDRSAWLIKPVNPNLFMAAAKAVVPPPTVLSQPNILLGRPRKVIQGYNGCITAESWDVPGMLIGTTSGCSQMHVPDSIEGGNPWFYSSGITTVFPNELHLRVRQAHKTGKGAMNDCRHRTFTENDAIHGEVELVFELMDHKQVRCAVAVRFSPEAATMAVKLLRR